MAGEAVIGALRVVIGADSAALDKGLDQAQTRMSTFASAMKKVDVGLAALAGAAVAAGLAVATGVKQAIDRADELAKASQKWGVPIEQLSALKHAADLSGVSFESLGTSLSKLSRNMSEAAGGGTSEAARAFEALGISVKDSSGNLKSSQQVMLEVSDKFKGMEDGAGKTALAMAVFGRSGAELIPLLNSGAAGITEMTDEARKLGLVMDSETGKAAENFNDNLTRLNRVWEGFINQLLPALLPSLNMVTNSLVEGAKATDSFKSAAEGIASIFTRVTAEVTVAIMQVTAFKDLLVGLGTAAQQFAALDLSGGVNTLTTSFSGLSTALDQANQKYREMLNPDTNPMVNPAALQAAKDGVDQKIKAPIIQATAAAEKATKATDVWGHSIEATAVKKRAADLITGSAEPWEQLRTEMAKAQADLIAFGATNEQIGAVMQKIAERYNNTWQQVSVGVAGSFQQIAQSFEGESKSMARIAKIAGIAQATISMFVGGAKALELPFPANIAAVAAVLAQGAAIVAQIKSVTGFADGGMMRVPGPGGRDNQRYMVDLSPGEQVDVWKPGEDGSDPRRGGGGGDVTINLHGENYSQKQVRRLIHEINQATRDGSRINVAGARA